jgi:hypothetical protein
MNFQFRVMKNEWTRVLSNQDFALPYSNNKLLPCWVVGEVGEDLWSV